MKDLAIKCTASLLALAALAACSGDATGARRNLAGQWIYRTRIGLVDNAPVGCTVVGTVRLTGSGNSFSGRMPVPEASCSGIYGNAQAFDSTTTLTAQVQGDSVLLTLRANSYEIRQTARILGDSLAGASADGSTLVAARRYADSVAVDRSTVRLTGAVTRTVDLYGYGVWNGLRLTSAGKDEAVLLLPTSASLPVLTVGTYAVGNSTAFPLYGYWARMVNGKVDQVQFTSGTVTITYADGQLFRGTIDVTGTLNAGSEQARVQADFVAHRSGYPLGS